MEKLIAEGLAPPRTILCQGPPGTGKRCPHIGSPLSSIFRWWYLIWLHPFPSFLGKTGSNLRRSLDYARAAPCVLLLDEFDAIAKRRDDPTDVGELKRIVNVLLKELEEWPFHSILFAATNHQEMIDPAMERRFDVVIDMPMPRAEERAAILRKSLGRFAEDCDTQMFDALAALMDGENGSDIRRVAQSAASRCLLEEVPLLLALLHEAGISDGKGIEKSSIGKVVRAIRKKY